MQRLRLCGINNLGNTCYLNTLLQSIKCIDIFENIMISAKNNYIPKDGDNILPIICDLGDIFEKMSAHPGAAMQPVRFINNLQQHIRKHKLIIVQQNDIHELYMFFLDMLLNELGKDYSQNNDTKQKLLKLIKLNDTKHSTINKLTNNFRNECNATWVQHFSKNYSELVPMFHGQYIDEITCSKCKNISYNYTPFNSLLLDLLGDKENVDIVDCIKNHFTEKILNNSEAKNDNELIHWNCENCNEATKNSKSNRRIYKMPQILVILFKRYNITQKYIMKDNRRILLNDGYLNFNQILGINFEYQLRSIGMHTGNLGGGHYYTIIKDDKVPNNFYEINDSRISKINNYNKKHVYMSCWELKNNEELS